MLLFVAATTQPPREQRRAGVFSDALGRECMRRGVCAPCLCACCGRGHVGAALAVPEECLLLIVPNVNSVIAVTILKQLYQ